MEWDMKTDQTTESNKRLVRVGSVHYHMDPIISWEEMEDKVTAFVEQASKQRTQFLLFPEYFGIHYFNCLPVSWSDQKRLDALVEKHERYIELFTFLASHHQIFIVGGSYPVKNDGVLQNIATLCSPGGNVYTQKKLHITPTEQEDWNYSPGNSINIFESKFGKVAIQICYDIEFPEVSRLLALHGVEIIFVPFYTRDMYGYQRVRYCAQARAVENYLYTVISGSFGRQSLPYDLSCYSQSAILTPSDIGFPQNAVASETSAYEEIVITADLDIDYLQEFRNNGTVRPLTDRRPESYSLESRMPIEIIKVE